MGVAAEVGVTFNSLFEMQAGYGGSGDVDQDYLAFNSLFEMLSNRANVVRKRRAKSLSILYLRCWLNHSAGSAAASVVFQFSI